METPCEEEKLIFKSGVLALILELTHNMIFNTYTMCSIVMYLLYDLFQRHTFKICGETLWTVIMISVSLQRSAIQNDQL